MIPDATIERFLVGGSIARGSDDSVSDLDLWLDTDDWSPEPYAGLFVTGKSVHIGESSLFQGLDYRGVIVDIMVGKNPPDDFREIEKPLATHFPCGKLEPSSVISDFWVNTHKHRKPIVRDLDGMILIGLHFDRMALLQAWVQADTGQPMSSSAFSIHRLTPIVKNHLTSQRQGVLGMPTRDRREILHAIQTIREEMRSLTSADSVLPDIVMNDPIYLELWQKYS